MVLLAQCLILKLMTMKSKVSICSLGLENPASFCMCDYIEVDDTAKSAEKRPTRAEALAQISALMVMFPELKGSVAILCDVETSASSTPTKRIGAKAAEGSLEAFFSKHVIDRWGVASSCSLVKWHVD